MTQVEEAAIALVASDNGTMYQMDSITNIILEELENMMVRQFIEDSDEELCLLSIDQIDIGQAYLEQEIMQEDEDSCSTATLSSVTSTNSEEETDNEDINKFEDELNNNEEEQQDEMIPYGLTPELWNEFGNIIKTATKESDEAYENELNEIAGAVMEDNLFDKEEVMGEVCYTTADNKMKKLTALWVADSGATCHLTNQIQGYIETRTTGMTMKYANIGGTTKCNTIGKWKGRQYFLEGSQIKKRALLILEDTMYVPDLTINLFSITKAMSQGAIIQSEGKDCLTITIKGHTLKLNHKLQTMLGYLLGALINPIGIRKEEDISEIRTKKM